MLLISLIAAILMLVIVYIPAFMAVSLVMVKKPGIAEKIKDQPLLTVFIIIPVILIISFIILLLFSEGDLASYGIKAINAVELIFFLIVGLAISLILQVITELTLRLSGASSESELLNEKFRNKIIISISLIILPSLGEELVFRGLIQTWVDIQEGFKYQEGILLTPGVLIGAILFAAVHLGLIGQKEKVEVIITVIIAAIIGICAGLMYSYSGSILPAVILHAESNLIGVIFDLFKTKKESPLM